MSDKIVEAAAAKPKKNQSEFGQAMKRLLKNKGAVAGLIILSIMVLVAIFSKQITPYNYAVINTVEKLQRPSAVHWFGTDDLGRDIFSRVVFGARYSLTIGLSATLGACLIGMILGSLTAYYGGLVDDILMRLIDILQSMPGMLLAICIAAVLGTGVTNTILALTISNIANYTRITRASMLTIRKMEYLDAAAVDNASDFMIIAKHMIPNALSPIIVQATMGTAGVILTASSLSFIGLGVPAPAPEWGAMLSAGRDYIRDYPYICIFPGLAIMAVVLALNLLGDGLRDAFDPKLKK